MIDWGRRMGHYVDIGVTVGIAILAIVVTVFEVPTAVSVPVGLLFLLVAPGYALTVAFFPKRVSGGDSGDGAELLDDHLRIVLAVTTSIALAVIVGVNLDFTRWQITQPTVVTTLSIVTFGASAIGAYRRSRIPERERARYRRTDSSWRVTSGSDPTQSTRISIFAVALVVLITMTSVVTVAVVDQRGEQYTEFGLLTENSDGELVATGYPSTLTADEPTSLTFTVTNQEQRTVGYTVVIKLAATNEQGEIIRETRLDSYSNRVPHGETWRRSHTVTPPFGGENLKLTYLLYTSDVPDRASAATAYRDLHLWVNATGA